MEFQIVNEISSFWGTLVPPIFLGITSISLFLWVIGKQNCEILMKRFINSDNRKYVLHNGLYIPQNQTTKYIFLKRISEKLGVENLKPLMIIFFIVLFFFGFNQLLIQIFQPMLVYYPAQLLYSSGIDDYLLANMWMYYPQVRSVNQLYKIIMDLTESTRSTNDMFLYSIEAFIRFDIVCCMLMFFRIVFRRRKMKWFNGKVFLRLIFLAFILMAALTGVLFLNIQRTNNEVRSRCYEAYSILEEKHNDFIDLSSDIQVAELENYLSVIKQDKERYGSDLYYGAFGIRSRYVEYITNIAREFYRFFRRAML